MTTAPKPARTPPAPVAEVETPVIEKATEHRNVAVGRAPKRDLDALRALAAANKKAGFPVPPDVQAELTAAGPAKPKGKIGDGGEGGSEGEVRGGDTKDLADPAASADREQPKLES